MQSSCRSMQINQKSGDKKATKSKPVLNYSPKIINQVTLLNDLLQMKCRITLSPFTSSLCIKYKDTCSQFARLLSRSATLKPSHLLSRGWPLIGYPDTILAADWPILLTHMSGLISCESWSCNVCPDSRLCTPGTRSGRSCYFK